MYTIKGCVSRATGEPLCGAVIRSFDIGLRTEQLLGQAITDEGGHYEIAYDSSALTRTNKQRADLIVRAYDRQGHEIAASPVIFQSQIAEIVDLADGRSEPQGTSEFQQLQALVSPLLRDVRLADLTQKDSAFLAGKTNSDSRRVQLLALAANFAEKTNLGQEVLYGLLRAGLPTTLPELIARDPEVQRAALQKAVDSNIIPAAVGDSIDPICERLRHIVIGRDLGVCQSGSKYSALGDLLRTTRLSAGEQDQVLDRCIRHKGTEENLWNSLGTISALGRRGPRLAEELQFTLQIGSLTQNDLPLVEKLQEMRRAGSISSPRDLARFSNDEWVALIEAAEPERNEFEARSKACLRGSANQDDENRDFLRRINRQLEKAFPTAVIARKVKEESNPSNGALLQFFESNPAFDFSLMSITSYLAEHSEALDAIAEDEVPDLILQLESMQRVFSITAGFDDQYEAMRMLRDDGLDSAQSIARLNQDAFCGRYAGSQGIDVNAKAAHAQATQRADTALAMFSKYSRQYNSLPMSAIDPPGRVQLASLNAMASEGARISAPDGGDGDTRAKGTPDWGKLFGSLNRCECAHCRSVLSPSAYLADLLALLDSLEFDDAEGKASALEMLLERRPDIVEVDLCCTNADSMLPYVDLVNEILENGVFPSRFLIKKNVRPRIAELNEGGGRISQDLREEFERHDRALSPKAAIEHASDTAWKIVDDDMMYIIENVVADGADLLQVTVKPPAAQTSGSAGDLGANPEHLDVHVYEVLKGECFPWSVPFDLWTEELRVYLGHLGVPRHRLMQLFMTNAGSEWESCVAAEFFGLTQEERKIIASSGSDVPWAAWGFDDEGAGPLSWIEELRRVPEFLGRSGSNYEQLTALLDTSCVNPNGMIAIEFPDLSDSPEARVTASPCDYTKATIDWDEDTLHRIHCFLRLQRKTAWSIREFDQILVALRCDSGDLDDVLLIQARNVRCLQNDLEIPLEELLRWFAPADAENGTVRQLFFDASTQCGRDAALEWFELDDSRSELQGKDQPVGGADQKSVICGVLQISSRDFDHLVSNVLPDEHLTLDNLSRLYRSASVARALRLSIKDFVSLRAITGVHPDAPEPQDPTAVALRFVAAADRLDRSGLRVSELDWLLRHEVGPQPSMELDDIQVGQILDGIRAGLRPIVGGGLSESGSESEFIEREFLSLGWGEALVQQVVELLKKPEPNARECESLHKWLSQSEPPEREVELVVLPEDISFGAAIEGKISYDADIKRLKFRGWMSEDERKELLALSKEDSYRRAIEDLYDEIEASVPESSEDRFLTEEDIETLQGLENRPSGRKADREIGPILRSFAAKVRSVSSEQLVRQRFSEVFSLDARIIDDLLRRLTVPPNKENDQKAIAPFVDASFVQSYGTIAATPKSFPDQFNALRLLNKVILLIDRLGIGTRELDWLFDEDVLAKCLKLDRLPITSPKETGLEQAEGFEEFTGLLDLLMVRDSVGAEAVSQLLETARDGSSKAALEALEATLGWRNDDIKLVQKALGLGEKGRINRWTGPALRRFQECFAALEQLGVSAGQAVTWSEATASRTTAQAAKQAVKAKYSQSRWLKIARPLRDALRERQRATLVGYLMAKMDLEHSHDLYQHYLVDVDMSPCMMTSRIKLAISSVQLYVQRLLMNLENRRLPTNQSEACKKQWQALKNYRVWEANRKVFLYPENWIEPDLRKEKTDLFKELESEVLQGELTTVSAEQAFRGYLERLDALVGLEICGLFHETEPPRGSDPSSANVLHVFGRTSSLPRGYYYRRRERGVWSAWEKIDAGVDSEHLVPVVFHDQLYLFWLEFTDDTKTDVKGADDKLIKIGDVLASWECWQVRLAVSRYQRSAWSPKKLLEGMLEVDLPPKSVEAKDFGGVTRRKREPSTDFTFKVRLDDTSMEIRCAQKKEEKGVTYADQGGFRFTSGERLEVLQGNPGELLPMPFETIAPIKGVGYDGMTMSLQSAGSTVNVDDQDVLFKTPRRASHGIRLICSAELPLSEQLDTLIYQDDDRTLLVTRDASTASSYRVDNFYHPATADFQRRLARDGVNGLLQRAEQERRHETVLFRLDHSERTFFESRQIGDVQRIFSEHGEILRSRGLSATDDLQTGGKLKVAIVASDSGPWKIEFARADDSVYWSCDVRKEDDGLLVYQTFEQQYGELTAAGAQPSGKVDFSVGGAYSQYNWEVFFHAPLLLADRLSKNQRFEEAQAWFHHIFDPTDSSQEPAPQRYWKVEEFYEESKGDPIIELLELVSYEGSDLKEKKDELAMQVSQWRESPFDPHVIARFRISAYQKAVVMKYLDNLIAWGDQLFHQDSIESINEATQLYVLAAEILGRRPVDTSAETGSPSLSFAQLRDETEYLGQTQHRKDRYHDAFVQLENMLPSVQLQDGEGRDSWGPTLGSRYFCVPSNDELLEYWDTVEDRLFKIRHCENIEGTERELALFQPPIDPGALVRSAAAGADIGSALRDLNAPLPHYRFKVMQDKAIEFCNDVRALGATFLSALEKKDAEGLEQLHRSELSFDLQRSIKQRRIEEAKQDVEDLEEARVQIEDKLEHIATKIDGWQLAKLGVGVLKSAESVRKKGTEAAKAGKTDATRKAEFKEKSDQHREHFESSTVSASAAVATRTGGLALAQTMYTIGAGTNAVPTVISGGAGISSPVALVVSGGPQIAKSGEFLAKSAETLFQIADVVFQAKEVIDEIVRAVQEAKHEKEDAKKEKARLEKRIIAAGARVEIAELEMQKVEKEAEKAERLDTYMRSRFTNLELHSWRASQLSTLYFQTYQMAYELAKGAERTFRYELGTLDSSYIRFGYWDSLKKGLLAGEHLHLALRRMEKAYLEQNKRGYEITKNISLMKLCGDKSGLVGRLMDGGDHSFELTEAEFDRDCPGHYLRRIKTVSLTVKYDGDGPPPGSNFNCTLTLLKNSVRMNNKADGAYGRTDSDTDARFRDEIGAVQSIVTSGGEDDCGLFVLDLKDDRYLPFEGAGAISSWRIELPAFPETGRRPCDVVIHLKYTARDGGTALKAAAREALKED